MINLIIFHYHFLPGGVTDVVTSAVISYLKYSNLIGNIKIVSGREDNLHKILLKIKASIPEEKQNQITTEIMPSIDYFEKINNEITSDIIEKELIEKYSSKDTIWWIHNYQLGKNPYFTKSLIKIATTCNQKMVFQIHDFPECSRYKLLNRLKKHIKEEIYPENKYIKYAVINNRDLINLKDAGMNNSSVFLLENPIKINNLLKKGNEKTLKTLTRGFSRSFPQWKNNERFMLYPVRAIRRKNVAEAALLSSLSEKNLIVTLPGVSDTEILYSNKCEKIFTEGLSPGMFGIGHKIEDLGISFDDLISASSLILSSSIQEGFGYLFLNSMNWGKSLFAKDLDILASFKKSFTGYPSYFYNCLLIPINRDDRIKLKELYLHKISLLKNQFSKEIYHDLKIKFQSLFDSEYADFSYLTLDMQISILKRIHIDQNYKTKCIMINKKIIEKLNNLFEVEPTPNHKILHEKWSFESYCSKTEEILHSFDISSPLLKKKESKSTIFETLQFYFTKPEYLRLIYDE